MNRTTVIQGISAVVAATATGGVVVTIEEAVLPDFINPSPSPDANKDPKHYDTVEEYATHRKVCSKTVRNHLHLLPHSTIGGIRINRVEADKKLDSIRLRSRRSKKKVKK
jgi:hypothetical protein